MNHFTLLKVPESPSIDLEELKQNYLDLAAQNHPDKNGDEDVFQQIQLAYKVLKDSHSRLKYFLEINGQEFNPRGSVSDKVMDFFMPISELIHSIDTHLNKIETAPSALQKAMLAPLTMELQTQVETHIDSLDTVQQELENSLTTLTTQQLSTTARDLAFITKWKAELRQKFAKLWI